MQKGTRFSAIFQYGNVQVFLYSQYQAHFWLSGGWGVTPRSPKNRPDELPRAIVVEQAWSLPLDPPRAWPISQPQVIIRTIYILYENHIIVRCLLTAVIQNEVSLLKMCISNKLPKNCKIY